MRHMQTIFLSYAVVCATYEDKIRKEIAEFQSFLAQITPKDQNCQQSMKTINAHISYLEQMTPEEAAKYVQEKEATEAEEAAAHLRLKNYLTNNNIKRYS